MFTFLLSCFHVISIFIASTFFYHHSTRVLGATISPVVTTSLTPTDTPSLTPLTTGPMPTVSLTPTDSPTPNLTSSPTTTPTPTVSLTSTPTVTPTDTPTPTPSIGSAHSPFPTSSGPSATPTPTLSPTPTFTPSPTPSPSPTPTLTPVPTFTPTPTVTPSVTPKPTATPTPIFTNTPTPTISFTPTPTPTASPTPSMGSTGSPFPINSGPTVTPAVTETPTPIATASPTVTPTPTEIPTPSVTNTPTPTPTKVGNDISYPQCGQTFPTGQGFGIVGVNDGIATTTNPCLGAELLWADLSLGTQNQPKVQLYVNTGNPGGLNTSSWPKNNTDSLGNAAPNPYGTCDGSDSLMCSWQYGWNRAVDDVQNKFIPTAVAAGVDAIPSDYRWWLDVETVNSWESGSDAALEKNRVDLEAMATYFESKGIKIGVYSTAYQWNVIVGSVPAGSNLNGLYSWLPGASDLAGAQANCALSSLTAGGSVVITQYTTQNFDYDYSCL